MDRLIDGQREDFRPGRRRVREPEAERDFQIVPRRCGGRGGRLLARKGSLVLLANLLDELVDPQDRPDPRGWTLSLRNGCFGRRQLCVAISGIAADVPRRQALALGRGHREERGVHFDLTRGGRCEDRVFRRGVSTADEQGADQSERTFAERDELPGGLGIGAGTARDGTGERRESGQDEPDELLEGLGQQLAVLPGMGLVERENPGRMKARVKAASIPAVVA